MEPYGTSSLYLPHHCMEIQVQNMLGDGIYKDLFGSPAWNSSEGSSPCMLPTQADDSPLASPGHTDMRAHLGHITCRFLPRDCPSLGALVCDISSAAHKGGHACILWGAPPVCGGAPMMPML